MSGRGRASEIAFSLCLRPRTPFLDLGVQMKTAEFRDKLKPAWPALDVHVHPLDCFGLRAISSPAEDADLIIESARRSGVEKMCLFSLHTTCPREPTVAQLIESNDYALAMRDHAPDVFLPFCYVNPMFPDESVAEIDRCVDGAKMCGIKLWVARRATNIGLNPILEKAVECDVPVLQHAWIKTTGNLVGESFPSDVADLARRHPDAKIIMAHMNGCGLRGIEDVAHCPNIYMDTSGGDPDSGITETAVATLGPNRVVYGSDAPIRHFGVQLGKTLGTTLPDDVKRDIIWNNTARLLPDWAGVDMI
ncbi:MAG: amidohydrolase [Gemmatimonadetes bacterium]|nr:amidohydrolase [Gemmatimonadota bacterium]